MQAKYDTTITESDQPAIAVGPTKTERLRALQALFVDGLEYMRQHSGRWVPRDEALWAQVHASATRRGALSAEQLAALATVANSLPNSNVGFDPIRPLGGTPSAHTCFAFGQGRAGWYFAYGNSTRPGASRVVGFTFIVFRLELAPPSVVRANGLAPDEAVVYVVGAGVGSDGTWATRPRQAQLGKMACNDSQSMLQLDDGSTIAVDANHGLVAIDCSWRSTQSQAQLAVGLSLEATKGAADGSDVIDMRPVAERHSLSVRMRAEGPAVWNGAGGCIPCIAGVGSLYWSWPMMGAQMRIDGGKPTWGSGWFDHQWLDAGAPRGTLYQLAAAAGASNASLPSSWIWLTLQLFGWPAYMLAVYLHAPPVAGATYKADLVNYYPSAQTTIAEKGPAASVRVIELALRRYPSRLALQIGDREYELQASFPLSLVFNSNGVPNWEGPARATRDGRLVGTGFIEANNVFPAAELNAMVAGPLDWTQAQIAQMQPKPQTRLRNQARFAVVAPILLLLIVWLAWRRRSH